MTAPIVLMMAVVIIMVVTVIIIEPPFFNLFFPLGQILNGKNIFADEKMVDFILVLCYKMSANKNKCRHIVTSFDKI